MRRIIAPSIFLLACASAVWCALGHGWAAWPPALALLWHLGERAFAFLDQHRDVARLKAKVATLSMPEKIEKLRKLGIQLPEFENERKAG